MRLVVLSLLAASLAGAASAHENLCYECGDTFSAGRELEVALVEQRYYRRVDHPSRMRRLRAEIAYTEERIVSLRRIQGEYDRVNRFGTGNALSLSAERVRLDLMREERVLRDLREQVLLEQRHYRFAKLEHAYRVQRAAVELAAAAAVATKADEPKIEIVTH